MTFDFSEALRLAKQGQHVRRQAWKEGRTMVVIQIREGNKELPIMADCQEGAFFNYYKAFSLDALAEDWCEA